jgi:hypothetical protein
MSPFFPFASAHDALWSLFARGPIGLAAQFFLDPQMTVAGTTATAKGTATRNRRAAFVPQRYVEWSISHGGSPRQAIPA